MQVATIKRAGLTALCGVLAIAGTPAVAKAPAVQHSRTAVPRAADGHPDFSGIWETLSEADYDLEPHAGRRDAPPSAGVVDLGHIPYLPQAEAQRKANFEHRDTLDPRLRCYVLSEPRAVYYPAPFQIFQRSADLTLVHQFGNQVRVIHKDGSLHPLDKDPQFWLGDSRAHWEGDTLVVDITGFNDGTWLDRAGNYHSDKLHVVERWKLIDANTIDYTATLDDPAVYSRPWSVNVLLNRRRDRNIQLIEDYCYTLQYGQFYPHKDGK
jgi:hypothetical protein